ncbi:MAG: sugar-binding transcriptional regulator [Verrucomicrobia bacterium]|nr:sugar-binding transcriptional regulator [Verrucomicrobiota bacterium]
MLPPSEQQRALAVQVARLYYYQGLTTEAIASELGLSRPKVSRLLTFARQTGLVEIKICDSLAVPQQLEVAIQKRFKLPKARVVTVPANSDEDEWLVRVATFTANHLNTIVQSSMTIGLAWGTTLDAISRRLVPKMCRDLDIVQLNGSANVGAFNNFFIGEIFSRFATNYGAKLHLFPVPTFFDYAETKQAMWRERSIQRLTRMMERADLLVYSIGSPDARIPSHVYVGGYLERRDFQELKRAGAVGDIATVFFRIDGSFGNISINARASGPDLSLFQNARHALCIVSGLNKVVGLRAALRGRLMNELIVDEPTAIELLKED